MSVHLSENHCPIPENIVVTAVYASVNLSENHCPTPVNIETIPFQISEKICLISTPKPSKNPITKSTIAVTIFFTKSITF